MVSKQTQWVTNADGQEGALWTLESPFLKVTVTDIGATLVSVICPDREGKSLNVVVGGQTPELYAKNTSYLGSTVGRFANRIGLGKFWLDGNEYSLSINDGPNHLHGGTTGLSHRVWSAEEGENSVTFRTRSNDGEDGYPGNLDVVVTYTVDKHILRIEYSAKSDSATVVNFTNHAYWNLHGSGSVLDHQIELFADRYLEVDSNILPTGEIADVAGTPFDFRIPKRIGDHLEAAGGYDHCFAIRGWDSTLRLAARAADIESGRIMEVHTSVPGVQLYTANHFDGGEHCGGRQKHEAFCLECQHFPDSPNHPDFPSTTLRPGQEYRQVTEHRFLTVK